MTSPSVSISIDRILQDTRYAIRRLTRERRFTATAVLILAVGVAACTVMFSVVDAVLLRPYNVDAPGRVVVMWPVQRNVVGEFTYNAARDLHRLQSLRDVASVSSTNWGGALTIPGREPLSVPCAVVSATFFDVLGARPLLGRTFRSEDDQRSASRVLILSHALWTQHFGADPNVIGSTVLVREESPAAPFEIIGVMPAEFFYPRGAQYWTPAAPRLAAIARQRNEPIEPFFDGIGVFYGVGRIRDGATFPAVQAETTVLLNAISQELRVDLTRMYRIALTPLLEHIFGPARRALLMLTGAVTLVLLIACINVAGLLVARGASRGPEMAVRATLGAGRGVLVRQLLIETGVLVLGGSSIGVSIAAASLRTLVALSPADIPRLGAAVLDLRVLALSICTAVIATLVAGIVPAMHVSRTSLVSDLKGCATGVASRGRRGRASQVLVASQVAGTLVLLIAAGLCVQSFVRLAQLDLGFDPANVLTFGVSGLDDARYPAPAQRHDVMVRILARLERLPQIVAAGAVSQRPFEHGPVGVDTGLLLDGQVDTPEAWSRNPLVNWEAVTPHYFRAMGIRLVGGRTFDENDTEHSPDIVIVSEAMAAGLWPGDDPMGKRLRANATEGSANGRPRWATVVGVVATARYREIDSPRLDLYVPFRQTSDDLQHFTVRTATVPAALAPTIASEISAVDRGLSMTGLTTMAQLVQRTRGPWRFNMLVFSAFGVVALSLAAVGLFGLVSYDVNQRTREIGVRIALGASRKDIVRLMVTQGAGPAATGLAIGVVAAVGVCRLLAGILFGVTPTDPATYGEVVALLAFVVLIASYLPARRAASVDPQVVLRHG
jgi:putative ABC transport system permease protein